MELSIIIVNYRSWNLLRACLESLLAEPPTTFPDTQIIVVDNASGDGQFDAFAERFPSVTFVQNPTNGGFAQGCNLGAGHASGRELLFLNPDVVASPQALQDLLRLKHAQPGVRILTLTQRDAKGRRQKVFGPFPSLTTAWGVSRAVCRLLNPRSYPDPRRVEAKLLDVDWVSGSALMIDRTAFDQLGGWDERFWMYYEDVDLCLRAAALGFRRCFTSDVELTHLHGGASRIDEATRALTRCEVTRSRHLYGHLHFGRVRAGIWHGVTFLGRSAPALILGALPFASAGRKTQRRLLAEYYAHVWRTDSWQSPRSLSDR